MLKIAIAGIGRWGKTLLEEFNQMSEVVACCHTGSSTNREWIINNYPKIKICDDLNILLSSNDLDAVVVSTPIRSHFSVAKQVLTSGLNVFVEKPPSTSQVEYSELLNLAHKKRLVLFTDNIFLYHPLYSKFKDMLSRDNIKSVEFKWFKFGTFTEDIFWNLAYHEIYLALSFFGKVKTAKILEKLTAGNNPHVVKFEIRFESGVISRFIINRNSKQTYKSIEVEGNTKKYRWLNDTIFEKNKSAGYKTIYRSSDKALKNSVKVFTSRLKSKTINKFEDSLTIETIKTVQSLKSQSS